VELAVWEVLARDEDYPYSVAWLTAAALFGDIVAAARAQVTPAMIASVNRALHSLIRKGRLIEARTLPNKGRTTFYATPRGWARMEARERRQREEAEKWARAQERKRQRRARRAKPATAVRVSAADRRKMAKILGMMGSAHAGERAAAATAAEELRRRLGVDWAALIGG
jgi:lysozyme family protein